MRVLFWGRHNARNFSVKLTGPAAWQDVLTSKIDWSGVETTKPTCQEFSILSFTQQTSDGLGEASIRLKPSGRILQSCGQYDKASMWIAGALQTEGNVQIFDQQTTRLASFTANKAEVEQFKLFNQCIYK